MLRGFGIAFLCVALLAPIRAEADARVVVVRSGDVLGAIANREGVRVSELKAWNNLDSDMIRVGQKLVIRKPSAKKKPHASKSDGIDWTPPFDYGDPPKGTDRFVEAMLRVLPRHPDVTALVIGRAAREHRGFLDDLRARIAEAGLAHRLLFPGEIGPREMPALIRGLSAVVMLPRYEGYGMVPLEAMASAVPFVATDTGAYRAFSGGGAAGTVVGLDDTGAAAEALDALLADPARIEAMGRAGRARAAAEYSAAAEARAITAVCERMWDEGA